MTNKVVCSDIYNCKILIKKNAQSSHQNVQAMSQRAKSFYWPLQGVVGITKRHNHSPPRRCRLVFTVHDRGHVDHDPIRGMYM